MKLIKIVFFFLFSFHLSAQDYFVKRISLDDRTNSGRSIVQHNERIFILAGHFCDNLECSSLAEVSINGDTLWVVRIHDIDVGSSSLLIHGDTITVTGNNAPLNTKFRMAHFDLNGEKLGETIEIEDPENIFTGMFQLTSVRFRGKTLVTGVGVQNSIEYGLIYVMNAEGELDTLIMLEPQDKESIMWEVKVDKDDNLYTYHDIDEGGFDDMRKKINKFDKNLNLIWTYQSEDSREWDGGVHGEILEDGRVLLVTYSPLSNSPHSSIRAINQDGYIDWQYDVIYIPFAHEGIQEVIGRVKQLPSGNILCMGRYTNIMLDEPVHYSPYMYLLSTEGEVIWKRVFYEVDPVTEVSRVGLVKDVIELDNGDLFGIGWMNYDGQREVFIFKIDADGCLDAEDCDMVQVITDVEEVEIGPYGLTVYPNPAFGVIHYSIQENTTVESVSLFDIDGRLLIRDADQKNEGQIDATRLPKGVYLMRFLMKNGQMVYRKVVKH